MIKNEFALKCVLGLSGVLIVACASGPKADIPTTANPQEELAKLSGDLHAAMLKNVDILDPKDFKKSSDSLNEAKIDLAKGRKQETVLDDLRVGRAALDKAYAESKDHEALAPSLFEARQAALAAGAADRPELQKDLSSLDSDTSDQAADLSKATSENLRKLQDRYVAIERRAVILTQLGGAQGVITGAKKDHAEKRAPKTLKTAELSLNAAESSISTNVRNPQGYQTSVTRANEDAGMLKDVMMVIAQNGKNLPEKAAINLVTQNRQINHLKTDLNASNTEGAATKTALDQSNQQVDSQNQQIDNQKQEIGAQGAALMASGEQLNAKDAALADKSNQLNSQGAALDSANAKVDIQRALENARSQFSPADAEAYQQGGNLLIRLKNMGFASGRSDLPTASLAILAKVSNVAKSLNASEIKVEGHTDSVGGKAQNKAISDARASAVATYFKANGFNKIDVESTGYGFEKPIATNKSKEGRAQNRRVDIIITPETATSAQ